MSRPVQRVVKLMGLDAVFGVSAGPVAVRWVIPNTSGKIVCAEIPRWR